MSAKKKAPAPPPIFGGKDNASESALYRRCLDLAGFIVIILEPDGTVAYVNQAGCAALGCSSRPLMGKNWFDIVVPKQERDKLRANFERLMTQGADPDEICEHSILSQDGTELLVAWRHALLPDENGVPAGLLCTGEDITQRTRDSAALRESEERLDLALHGANLGMWDWDIPSGEVVYSDLWASMLGYAPEELAPNVSTWDRLLHPDDTEWVQEVIELHFAQITESYEVEFRLLAKDGSWRWILARGRVMERAPDGSPLRMTGTHLDITKRKESEQELKRRNAMEKLLSSITFSFVDTTPQSLATAFQEAVRSVGRFLHADRGYVYILDESGQASILTKWCGSRVVCQVEDIADIDFESLPWLQSELSQFRTVRIGAMDNLPKTAGAEAEFFRAKGVRSFIAAPIVLEGNAVGFAGFDSVDNARGWNNEDALLVEAVANILSQAVKSMRQTETLNNNLSIKKALAELYPPLISMEASLEQLSDIVMKKACELTNSPHGLVGAVNSKTRAFEAHNLTKMMEYGCSMDSDGDQLSFHRNDVGVFPFIWATSLNTLEPFMTNDLPGEAASRGVPAGHIPIQRYMSVPVMLEGQAVGLIGLANKPEQYTKRNIDAVKQLAEYMALALQGRRVRKRLQESESRFKKVVETMTDGLIISDEHGAITYANSRFAAMLGYPVSEILGNRMTRFLSTRGQEQSSSHFANRKEFESISLDLVLETKNGDQLFVILAPATILDDAGVFQGTFSVVHDITDRKILESQLLQAQKLESIGQLAAGIAHEINTPSQYVGNNLRFLKQSMEGITRLLQAVRKIVTANETGDIIKAAKSTKRIMEEIQTDFLAKEIPEALNESLEGMDRITEIVQSVKNFAHPGNQKKRLENLNEAILSTITVSTNEWKYVADLNTDLDPNLPLVPCFLGEFNQVLLNLIINASHAIQDVVGDTGQKGVITISTRASNGYAEIRVSDTGTGIPKEIRTRIFDPFFTTKEVGRGTGQGLNISHEVIQEKHGGSLSFETEVGKGTSFIIMLPTA